MRARAGCFVVVSALLVWGCSSTTPPPLRNTDDPAPAMHLTDLEGRLDVPDGPGAPPRCSDPVLRTRSIERFLDDNGKEFDLGVIELSDDGHVYNFIQEEKVLQRLREVALGGSGKAVDVTKSPGAVVLTFVHGWHHRAKVCDNNLACFRRVLQTLSQANERPVFGVYIGWRGDSLHGKASVLTFFDRKNTAQNIGHEGGREVLLKLDEEYRSLNDTIKNGTAHPVTMVTAGHSFGGALVYSAVEAALVRELPNPDGRGSVHVVGKFGVKCGDQTIRPIRPGIGDLVVLVNPAFEASRYEQFAADVTAPGVYSKKQMPVLLTVASEADSAVKTAFPAGRIVYFSIFPWRYRQMSDIIGAGHYDPQTTHDLVVADNSGKEIHPGPLKAVTPPEADQKTIDRCHLDIKDEHDYATCACEYPVPTNLAILDAQKNVPPLTLSGGAVRTTPDEMIVLKSRQSGWDTHAPFIVARAAPDIISQHSDIYTPRFVTFLAAYIKEFLTQEFLTQAVTDKPGSNNAPCSAVASFRGAEGGYGKSVASDH
jgi:hypothetical protein